MFPHVDVPAVIGNGALSATLEIAQEGTHTSKVPHPLGSHGMGESGEGPIDQRFQVRAGKLRDLAKNP